MTPVKNAADKNGKITMRGDYIRTSAGYLRRVDNITTDGEILYFANFDEAKGWNYYPAKQCTKKT